jgi:hypothetical protein
VGGGNASVEAGEGARGWGSSSVGRLMGHLQADYFRPAQREQSYF